MVFKQGCGGGSFSGIPSFPASFIDLWNEILNLNKGFYTVLDEYNTRILW